MRRQVSLPFIFFSVYILSGQLNISFAAISIFNRGNGQNNSGWPTAIFLAVGQQFLKETYIRNLF